MSRRMSHHDEDIDIGFEHVPPDRLHAHSRRQLSAMLDGELPPDQARFMLRRLQHDAELAACWERWQVCGDVLRGQGHALLPGDFSARVVGALGAGPVPVSAALPTRRPRHGLLRWGGGALAASVALGALFMARQLPDAQVPELATASSTMRVPSAAAGSSGAPLAGVAGIEAPERSAAPDASSSLPLPEAPGGLAALATAAPLVAGAAEVPRRAAERRTTRSQSQRAVARRSQEASPPAPRLVAGGATPPPLPASPGAIAAAPPMTMADPGPLPLVALSADPGPSSADSGALFGGPVAAPRPWPRAVLPGIPRAQPYAAGLGLRQSDAFAPFQPRIDDGGRATVPRHGVAMPPPDRGDEVREPPTAGSAR